MKSLMRETSLPTMMLTTTATKARRLMAMKKTNEMGRP